MSNMRILFTIKSVNRKGGGAERVMADISGRLAERGHDVLLLTWDRADDPSFYRLHPAIRRIGIPIGPIDRPSGVLDTIRRVLALRKAVLVERPDVVVGFMHSMFVPTALALAGTGIPVIASEHIVKDHYRTRPMQWLAVKVAARSVKRFVCVSDQAAAAYSQWLRKKTVVIANPVTLRSGRLAELDPPGRKTLLSVGRLEKQKDHKTLLKAFALLINDCPDWDLVIVGEGRLRGELNAYAEALSLGQRVSIPGAVEDITAAYERAQLFVQPSLYESFGLTTVEAFQHGLPAVGFADCPGTNILIEHGRTGALATVGLEFQDRSKALATTLKPLMQDASLRQALGVNAREVAATYSADPIIDQWEMIIEACL